MKYEVCNEVEMGRVFEEIESGDELHLGADSYHFSPTVDEDYTTLPHYGAPLWLVDKNDILIQGSPGAEIMFMHHGNGLLLQNCNNILLRDVRMRGQGPLVDKEWYFALIPLAGKNRRIVLDNCRLVESGNHGIANLYGPRDTYDSIVRNCYFENIGNMRRAGLGRDGAAVALGGCNNLVEGCLIRCALRGVELECGDFPPPKVPTGCIIQSNTFDRCYWQSIIVTPNSEQQWMLFCDTIIANNVFKGWGMDPPPAQAWGGHFIHEAIVITGGKRFQIISNQISDMWGANGMRIICDMGPFCDGIVAMNVIDNCGRSGICMNNDVRGNIERNQVVSNTIRNCAGYPLWVVGNKNQIVNNNVQANKEYGWCKIEGDDNITSPNFIL